MIRTIETGALLLSQETDGHILIMNCDSSEGVSDVEELLVHNALNEILHGLQKTSDVARLLKKQQELESLYRDWRKSPNMSLVLQNRALMTDVIQVVIEQLGDDEFSVRTGVEISEAQRFLRRLHTFPEHP